MDLRFGFSFMVGIHAAVVASASEACEGTFGEIYENVDLHRVLKEFEDQGNALGRLVKIGPGYASNPVSLALSGAQAAKDGQAFGALGQYDAAILVVAEKSICDPSALLFLIGSLKIEAVEMIADDAERNTYLSMTRNFGSQDLQVLSWQTERVKACLRSVAVDQQSGSLKFDCLTENNDDVGE